MTALLAPAGVAAFFAPPGNEPTHPAVRETALAAFIGWCFGVLIAVAVRDPGGPDQCGADETRLFYTWGCAMCLFHIAVAFHVAHAWSHAAAWDHVARTGGFGWGLYVNYLFVVVWTADVVWAWVSLDSYLNRPRWVSLCVHSFMAFIVLNATVVFGRGWVRWFGVLMFVAVAIHVQKAARRPGTPEPGSRPGSADTIGLPRDHSPT